MCVPMISIIIPVYNTEKYIVACMDSIVKQTYQDYEVLLINDGSTDASPQIIADYIRDHQLVYFHLINKENGGASSARNLGLEKAQGKWIAFVDSDDLVEPEYLQHMIEGLAAHPADFCMTGYKKYHEYNNTYTISEAPSFAYGDTKDVLHRFNLIHPVSKLYSSCIIQQNNLRFDTRLSVGEDRAFNFVYLCYTHTLLVTEGSRYIYRLHGGSLTTNVVRPSRKRGLSEYAFLFWNYFANDETILKAYISSYHIAHNVLDSILCDILNAVIDRKPAKYRELVRNPVTRAAVKYFHHSASPITERTLVFLLRYRLHFAVKALISIYYSNTFNKVIRKLLRKDRK